MFPSVTPPRTKFLRLKGAVTVIQKAWRGYQCRKNYQIVSRLHQQPVFLSFFMHWNILKASVCICFSQFSSILSIFCFQICKVFLNQIKMRQSAVVALSSFYSWAWSFLQSCFLQMLNTYEDIPSPRCTHVRVSAHGVQYKQLQNQQKTN